MADILIVGFKPNSEKGKEFFLHSTDWWYEILDVIVALLPEDEFLEDYFIKECWLCPLTPYMERLETIMFAEILEKYLSEDKIRSFLMKMYLDEQLYQDYFEGDVEYMEESIAERIDQINEFIGFLKESGGCRAKWDGMDWDD